MDRKKSMKKYSLTAAHRAQLKPWVDKWIANAMSTKPMDDTDRAVTREAMKGLYRAAELEPPPDHRIVFVSSPFVLRFSAGFASAIWWLRKKNAATRLATDEATNEATNAATRLATDAATRLATDAATRLATDAAMNDATRNAWWRTGDFKAVALGLLKRHAIFGLRCANEIYRLWQGGNQWSAYDSYISFFRNIAKLEIDYSRWAHWEAASLHGGPRIMHEKFCMISDRPRDLTVDDQNRPHNATGPFCKWSDGSSLFAWHGTRMPARYYFEEPTAVEILAERNVEVRRCLIERYDELNGRGSFMRACGAKVLDSSVQPMHVGCTEMLNELLAIELPDDPEGRMVALRVVCPSTAREYIIRVPPDQTTVLGALAWTFDMKPSEYRLAQET